MSGCFRFCFNRFLFLGIELLHLTYAELTDAAKSEQNDNARPEYVGELPDLSSYDTIFIGAPV
jgi:hypothetical protein